MITLYTIHCEACKVLEAKLKQKNIEFDMVDDKDTVIEVGKEHGILSAPILQVDDTYLDYTSAIKYVRERG